MNTHHVVLFLNIKYKQFSVTARKPDVRLNAVIAAERKKGYIDVTICRDLTKEAASARAAELKEEWLLRGFSRNSRDPLS